MFSSQQRVPPLSDPKVHFYLVFFNIDFFNENRMVDMSRISVETRAESLRVDSQTSEARLDRYIHNFGSLISHLVLVLWYRFIGNRPDKITSQPGDRPASNFRKSHLDFFYYPFNIRFIEKIDIIEPA